MSAQYPGAAGTDANLLVAVNNLSTSLSDNPLTIGATTVNVASTTNFPTAGYITIEAEAISYTGVTGTSFTGCARGADGTAAASHVTGLSVFHDVVAAHHNVLKDEIKAIETDLVASYTGGSTTIATTFAKYLKLIGGTLSGALAMGTNKVTGLGAATVNGDALRFEQLFGGTVTLVDNLIFNPTTKGVKGTTTNDAAPAGNVGEYVESVISANTNFPATTLYGDLTSISLTAGDWEVSLSGVLNANAATISGFGSMGISTTTGNSSTGLVFGDSAAVAFLTSTVTQISVAIPAKRFSLSTTTTIYFKYQQTYSAGTPVAVGRISARRLR